MSGYSHKKAAFALAGALTKAMPFLKGLATSAAKSFATGAATTAGSKAVNAITSPAAPPKQQGAQSQNSMPANSTYIS